MNETVDELDRRKKDSPQSSCTFLPAGTGPLAGDPKALKHRTAFSFPTPTENPCRQSCRNFDPSILKVQSKPPTAKHHHPPRRRPSQQAPPTTTTTMTSLLRRWLPSALRPSTRLISTTAPLTAAGRTSPPANNPLPTANPPSSPQHLPLLAPPRRRRLAKTHPLLRHPLVDLQAAARQHGKEARLARRRRGLARARSLLPPKPAPVGARDRLRAAGPRARGAAAVAEPGDGRAWGSGCAGLCG